MKTTGAEDFLNALIGEPEIFETDGVTVKLRSLTYAEVQGLVNQYRDNNTEMAFQALTTGLVEPVLTPEQLEKLRAAKPGPIMKMAQRVMEISGMLEGASPLAGSGSSPST